MNRKLISQTLNDWRSNLWLAVELLIVSVVVWYTVDFCYITYLTYIEPMGFEIDHCYKISVGEVGPSSPEYVQRDGKQAVADRLELIDRLRRRPEIEVASFSNMAYPYNTSNSSEIFRYDSIWTQGMVFSRYVTPEFLQVFRIRGARGESPEQLGKMLDTRGLLISSNLFDDGGVDRLNELDLIHDSIRNDWVTYEVLGVTNPMRSSEYVRKAMYDKGLMHMVDYNEKYAIYHMDELCVRVRDNMDQDFVRNLMSDASKHYRVGNLFISAVDSFDNLRDIFIRNDRMRVIWMVTGMVFLLINVFLGLFGTFWFRTQQRVSEIAIRKVNGATRGDILRRLLGEGLVILSVVTIPAICVDALLTYFEFNQSLMPEYPAFDFVNLFVCAFITYALIALMIIAGISIPACRAMNLDPATALHDE